SKDQIQIKAPLMLSIFPDKSQPLFSEPHLSDPGQNQYIKLFHQLGGYKKIWYIYLFSALFAASITQLAVFVNQVLIDHILPSFQLNILILFAIGLGLFKLFELVVSQYKYFISIHLGNVLDRFFLGSFDQKLNDYSIRYIRTFNRGDLSERLSDAMKLKAFFLRFFTRILVDSFVACYSLLLLFLISWQLTFVVGLVMLLFYAWFRIITPYLKTYEQKRFIRKADFFSKMLEKIEGLQVIKSFGIESDFSREISQRVDQLIDVQTRVRYFNLLNSVVVSCIITLAYLAIVIVLTKNAIEAQSVSIGQIITFIALSVNIFHSLGKLLKENLTLQEHEVILRRYFDFEEQQVYSIGYQGINTFVIDQLSLKDIHFSYHPTISLLSGISMEIEKGDKIRIEGGNGSGKSTLGKVLSQLYEQSDGELLINGLNVQFYDKRVLQKKLLLISSEDILFNDSLAFNIGLGKKQAVRKVLRLAKQIGFYDFIAEKEEGLQFLISENGRNLSTGQRKKILLLRALTSNAEIIVIDEVLSGIDQSARLQAEQLLNQLEQTIIMISHEPVHEIQFNKQYRLENGQLIS
ncbi:MAG: ABC transporter transmembrane domain-containing protein, partial [Bacteroidota bacterium]